MNGPDVVEKQSDVAKSLEECRGAVGFLGEEVEYLEQKLNVVLRQSVPSDKNEAKPQTERVPLAVEISSFAGSVQKLAERLSTIRDRIEL